MSGPDRPGSELKRGHIARHGLTMRANFVVRKTAVVKTTRRVRELIGRYLVEDSKSPSRQADPAPRSSSSLKPAGVGRIFSGQGAQRPGVDYIASQVDGLRVYGFLNDVLTDLVENPFDLSHADLSQMLSDWWIRSLKGREKLAYHYCFSLNPLHTAKVTERGIPIDDVLMACIAEAFLAFNTRFYPNTSLGWLTGFHHDTAHTHAHVLLYPMTAAGRGLNVSPDALTRIEGRQIRVDYQAALRQAYARAVGFAVNTVGMDALVNPAACTPSIVSTLAGFESFRNAHMSAHGGTPPERPLLLTGWADGIRSPRLFDLFATSREAVISREIAQANKLGPKSLTQIETELAAHLASHQQTMAAIQGHRSKVDSLFREWRGSPDIYRMSRYGRRLPPLSPSGTLSLLGYSLDSLAAARERPAPTKSEIEARLQQRMRRLDEMLARHHDMLPKTPIISRDVVDAQSRRAIDVFHRGTQLLNTYLHRHGRATLTGQTPEMMISDARPMDEARSLVNSIITRSAREVGALFHSATSRELIEMFEQAELRRKGGLKQQDILDGDETDAGQEIDSGETPDEQPIELELPQRGSLVPANPNFLEREACSPVRTRSFTDIRKELQETEEALRRLVEITARDRFIRPDMPSP